MGFNENDFISLLIFGIIELKVFPPYKGLVEWTCVKTASKIISEAIFKQYKNIPNEYNIISKKKTSYENLYEALILEGYTDIKKCDVNTWNQLINNNKNSLSKIGFILQDGLFGSNFNQPIV